MSGFLKWLASLPPFAQIPIVVAAFLAVAGIVIFFIEIAPRSGRRYTVIRLLVCVLAPLGIFFAVGSVWWAAAAAAVLGALFFLLDYRAKAGQGYLFQLIGFLAPAIALLGIGLVFPTIATFFKAFMNARGSRFVGFENFIYVFGQEGNRVAIINTVIWVLVVPALSTIAGLAYAVFVDKARGERFLKALVFMPMAISFVGASIIWKFVYDANQAGPAPDRVAERHHHVLRRQPVRLHPGGAVEQPLPHGHPDLGADRIRDGRAVCGDQGCAGRADGSGGARWHERLAALHERDGARHPQLAHRRAHDDLDRLAQGVRHRADHDRWRERHQRARERGLRAEARGGPRVGASPSSCSSSCCRSSSTTSGRCVCRRRSDERGDADRASDRQEDRIAAQARRAQGGTHAACASRRRSSRAAAPRSRPS